MLLLLAGGGLWSFLEIADEVREGDTHATDRQILLALRNQLDLSDPIGPEWVEELGRDLTALGGIGVLGLITLGAALFLLLSGKRGMAWYVLAAIGSGMAASFLLKSGYDRPRPDLVPHGAYVYTRSFPSGHSMISSVVYLTLGALLARSRSRWTLKVYFLGAAVLLTLLVGASRVYLGVHWPTDVLAGWTAGMTWAIGCWLLVRRLQRRGRVEAEDEAAPPASGPPSPADA